MGYQMEKKIVNNQIGLKIWSKKCKTADFFTELSTLFQLLKVLHSEYHFYCI